MLTSWLQKQHLRNEKKEFPLIFSDDIEGTGMMQISPKQYKTTFIVQGSVRMRFVL